MIIESEEELGATYTQGFREDRPYIFHIEAS